MKYVLGLEDVRNISVTELRILHYSEYDNL